MRWKCRIISLMLCFTVLCSGCMSGSGEIDTLSFILTIGVDQSDEPGQYIFTFRVAMPRAFTGDNGGSNKEKSELVSVKAPAIGTAISQLSIAINRNVELSHVSALFVHEDVAKNGIQDFITLFMRSKIYRNTMIILVTKENVKDVMEKNTTPFELFQYRWVDSVKRTQSHVGSYALNDVRNFYIAMAEPQKGMLTAYGTIIENSLNKKAKPPLPAQLAPQYSVDSFPREGGTELIVVGSAIFKDWKMVGSLNSVEALGANILTKGVELVYAVPDPIEAGQVITIRVIINKPKISIDLQKDEQMHINIDAHVVAQLGDSNGHNDYMHGEKRKILEDQISENVRSSIMAYFAATQPLEVDAIQVSNKYRRKVLTWADWAKYDWSALYGDAQVDVNVKSDLYRSGLVWRYVKGGENI